MFNASFLLENMRSWYKATTDAHRRRCLHAAAEILQGRYPSAASAQDAYKEWGIMIKEKSKELGDQVLAGQMAKGRVGRLMREMLEAQIEIRRAANWERENDKKLSTPCQ